MEKDREYKMMNDVVTPGTSRTIRRVPINRREIEEDKVVEEYVPPRRTSRPSQPIKSKGNSIFTKLVLVFIVIVSVVAIVAALSLAYSKGTLTIEPKKVDTKINVAFTATSKGDDLNYKTLTASDVSQEVVPAKPGKFIQTKAKGTVSIKNSSSASQTLVANTRIESEKGKIYRISKNLIIPAGKSLQTVVTADEAGEDFNISKTEATKFTIPGFKGSKKFSQFEGELVTDISGGFSGTKNIVDPKTLTEVKNRLSNAVTELVKAKLKAQVGPDLFYSDDLVVINTEELPQVAKGSNQSQISVKGTGIAYIFDTDALIKTLGASEVKKLGSSSFKALGIDKMSIVPKNPLKYSLSNPLNLVASGDLTLIGDVPLETLKKELVGVKIDDLNIVLKRYEGIGKASAKISPFWKKSFPSSPDRINILAI